MNETDYNKLLYEKMKAEQDKFREWLLTDYYLKYRDGKRVVSQYVSRKEIEKVRALVEKRRHIEAMVKSLQEEKAIADKVLEGAV